MHDGHPSPFFDGVRLEGDLVAGTFPAVAAPRVPADLPALVGDDSNAKFGVEVAVSILSFFLAAAGEEKSFRGDDCRPIPTSCAAALAPDSPARK